MATNADGEKPQEVNPFAGFVTEVYQHGELVEEPKSKDEKPKETPKPKEEPKPVTPEPKPAAVDRGDGAGDGDGEKPKKTVQERINEVTRARREAERRADAAEARIRDLEAKAAAPKPEEPAPKPAAAAPAVDPNEPQPDKFEYGELDPRYIRAVAEYGAEKKFNELRERENQQRSKTAEEEKLGKQRVQYEAMIETGSKVHEDFYEKVVIGAEEGTWPMSKEMGELLLESEVGPAIAYHLANNPQEAKKLYDAPPREQARMFGKLETKFENAVVPVEQAAAPVADGKPAPKAPKAPAPVAAARGAAGQFEASADSDDFAAFEARVNQQR